MAKKWKMDEICTELKHLAHNLLEQLVYLTQLESSVRNCIR